MRISPIHEELRTVATSWTEMRSMRVVDRVTGHDVLTASILAIADVSCLHRAGIKGPRARTWLHTLDVPVPERPNTWLWLDGGGVVCRLGRDELLIEDGPADRVAESVREAVLVSGVYPVMRQDAAFVLMGSEVNELLSQTCSIDFQSLTKEVAPLVITSMAGVSVTIVPVLQNEVPFYRVWCDGTYGVYLWRTLRAIACELGGGAVGIDVVLPLLKAP